MRRLRRGTLAAVLAATLAVAGCGDSGDDGDDSSSGPAPEALSGEAAEQALADAALATNEATEPVEASLGGSVSGLPTGDLSFGIEGTVDPASELGDFEFEVNDASLDILLLEDAAYVSSDSEEFTSALPEGAEWVEISPEELGSVGLNTTFGEGGFSPQIYLVLGAGDVEAGDTGEVGDDAVRYYSFSIDQDEAVREAPAEARAGVRDAITLEGESPSIEGEASIDGEGRLRSFKAHGSAGSSFGGDIEVDLFTDFEEFGAELDTEAPSDDEIVSLADAPEAATAIQQLLGSGSS